MTPEDKKYYEDLFHTFSTDGWNHVIEKAQLCLDALDSVKHIPDERALFIRQGEIKNLEWLIGLEQEHRAAYEELNADL